MLLDAVYMGPMCLVPTTGGRWYAALGTARLPRTWLRGSWRHERSRPFMLRQPGFQRSSEVRDLCGSIRGLFREGRLSRRWRAVSLSRPRGRCFYQLPFPRQLFSSTRCVFFTRSPLPGQRFRRRGGGFYSGRPGGSRGLRSFSQPPCPQGVFSRWTPPRGGCGARRSRGRTSRASAGRG